MTKSYIKLVSKFEGHKWDLVKQRVLIAVPMDVDYEKIVETVRLKNFRAAVNRVRKIVTNDERRLGKITKVEERGNRFAKLVSERVKNKTLALKDTTENPLI